MHRQEQHVSHEAHGTHCGKLHTKSLGDNPSASGLGVSTSHDSPLTVTESQPWTQLNTTNKKGKVLSGWSRSKIWDSNPDLSGSKSPGFQTSAM